MKTLTKNDVMKMEAGPQLDALVAERVMGWKSFVGTGEVTYWIDEKGRFVGGGSGAISPYSTNIMTAWEVVEHFSGPARNHRCVVVAITEPDEWSCEIGAPDDAEDPTFDASAPTAPLAICRAALLATLRAKAEAGREGKA